MSLFQCSKCGSLENTALAGGYHMRHHFQKREDGLYHEPAVVYSYKQALGLKEEDELGAYCSACNPVWYDEHGGHGCGPRPAGYTTGDGENMGQWHGKFDRIYLPKGLFHTDDEGNLRHIETLAGPEESGLARDTEWPGEPKYAHPDFRLPAPRDPGGTRRWKATMAAMMPAYWGGEPRGEVVITNAEVRAKIDLAGGLLEVVREVVEAGGEVSAAGVDPIAALNAAAAGARQPGKNTRRALAASAIASGLAPRGRSRPEPEPARAPTPAETQAAAARSKARLAAAERKRARKAGKRVDDQARTSMGQRRFRVFGFDWQEAEHATILEAMKDEEQPGNAPEET